MVRHGNYACLEVKFKRKKTTNITDEIQIWFNCCQATKNGGRFVPPQSSAAATELNKIIKELKNKLRLLPNHRIPPRTHIFFAQRSCRRRENKNSGLNLIQIGALKAYALVQGARAAQPRANTVFTLLAATTALLHAPVLCHNWCKLSAREEILIVSHKNGDKSLLRRGRLRVMVIVLTAHSWSLFCCHHKAASRFYQRYCSSALMC